MAITYQFSCHNCTHCVEVNIGTTRMALKKGTPDVNLGACYSCGKLFGNKRQQCIHCLTRTSKSSLMNKVVSFFKRNNLSSSLRFYKQDEVKKVECPRCRYKYMEAYPTLFSD